MRLTRGTSLDFRKALDLEPLMAPILDAGFDTILAVIESESDGPGIERLRRCVDVVGGQGLDTVAYLADGNQGLRCLSQDEEVNQKVKSIQNLATTGVAGIIFRGFTTGCYYCNRCADSLERSTGLKLPLQCIGNPEEVKKWYSPDPLVYGFDSPYNRANRIEEVLQVIEWMGDGLKTVASRIATATAGVNPNCRLGLVGLNPIGLKVLNAFAAESIPIVFPLANTYITFAELELYIQKLPFDGLRREWMNLMTTSAYYHTAQELNRIILRAAIEGRFGVIIWAAGGVSMSFGRLEDMTAEHWAAVKLAFQVIRAYEKECEQVESAGGMYWTSKGGARNG